MSDSQTTTAKRWVAITTRWIVGVGVLLLAMIIAAVLVNTAPKPHPGEEPVVATNVPVIALEKVEIARQWRGLGTVQPVSEAAVPAEVAAVVTRVAPGIDEGVRVDKGQVLAELESDDFERQAEIAQANLKDIAARIDQLNAQEQRLIERRKLEEDLLQIAREERDRVTKIYESGAAGRQGLDQARRLAIETERGLNATLEQLDTIGPQRGQLEAQRLREQASLELALLNVKRCTIRSPIAGLIQSLDIEVGESLSPGQRVALVVGITRVEVPLNVPASARNDLSRGDPVQIRSASHDGRVWRATISRILPQDDPQTRTATFFAEVEQPGAEEAFGTAEGASLLLPGAFVRGMVSSGSPKPRWIVPRRAVRNDRVLLVREGIIESCAVEADFSYEGRLPRFGIADDQWVVLQEGTAPFEAGDLLVVNVSLTLQDGARIDPMVMTPSAENTVSAATDRTDLAGASR